MPPEVLMHGRKIKRGLPLMDRRLLDYDKNDIEARDQEMKSKAKHREDARRGARKCPLKPGDTVIVERQTRAKGDSRFGKQRFTVMEERNGNLVLGDDEGRTMKRHVSQTKKVVEWRDESFGNPETEEDIPTQRATRNRKVPKHLQDFICATDVNENLSV